MMAKKQKNMNDKMCDICGSFKPLVRDTLIRIAKDVANLTELETEEFALELKTILTESQLEIIKEKL